MKRQRLTATLKAIPGATGSRGRHRRFVDLPTTTYARSRRLRTNITWAFAGNVIYTATQWGILVALARLGSPSLVGQFAFGLAVTAPIFLLGDLNLRVVQATDTAGRYTFGEYLAVNLLITPFQLLVVFVVTTLIDIDAQTRNVILAVGMAKAVESTTMAFYGLFQQHERMDYVARSQVVRGIGGLLALTSTVLLVQSLPWGVLAMAFAWLANFAFQELGMARRLLPGTKEVRPAFGLRRLARLAAAAFPLGVDSGIKSLTVNVPRYVVQALQGSARLGVFASIAQLAQVLGVLTAALGNAVVPRLAVHIADGNCTAFNAVMRKLLLIGAALGFAGVVGAAIAGEQLLSFVFGPAYVNVDVLLLLMLAAALTTVHWILGFAIQAARRFVLYLVVDAVTAAFVTIATVLLVPHGGIIGAALGLVVGFAVGSVASISAVFAVRYQLSRCAV